MTPEQKVTVAILAVDIVAGIIVSIIYTARMRADRLLMIIEDTQWQR